MSSVSVLTGVSSECPPVLPPWWALLPIPRAESGPRNPPVLRATLSKVPRHTRSRRNLCLLCECADFGQGLGHLEHFEKHLRFAEGRLDHIGHVLIFHWVNALNRIPLPSRILSPLE